LSGLQDSDEVLVSAPAASSATAPSGGQNFQTFPGGGGGFGGGGPIIR
jgi:hypothetical protein